MRLSYALLPLAAFLSSPAWAEPIDHAGHYYLRGVMEAGSELMLHPNGRFQWYLVYGALNLFAEGRWREADGKILLQSENTKDVPKPGFATLTLVVRDKSLISPDGRGAYIRLSDESN